MNSNMFPYFPEKIWSRDEVLARPSPIPSKGGLYFWWFKHIPAIVPLENCLEFNGLKLLYIGIAPDGRTKPNSRSTLRKRIKNHFRGNAACSTLRKTLGILLANESGFPLRRVGTSHRLTFTHLGEQWLDDWMQDNAFVSWVEHDMPWVLENKFINSFSLPLNIQGNDHHKFKSTLSHLRSQAIKIAKEMESVDQSGNQRSNIVKK